MVAEVDALLSAYRPAAKEVVNPPPPELCVPPAGKAVVLPPCEADDCLAWLIQERIAVSTVVLDPWYLSKQAAGRTAYLSRMVPLIDLASRVAQHVYVWGYPESVGRLIDHWPDHMKFSGWITWWAKNIPSRSRGWRPCQQACLHLSTKGAPLYPEQFYNERHRDMDADNKLVFKMTPQSVIEAGSLHGSLDRAQQTGYPSQKPRRVIEPLLRMTCRPGDLVVDATCGAGTVGEVAASMGCRTILSDRRSDALRITRQRLLRQDLLHV
ncbi:DNA methyltransferase [Algiphilus sp.]|uniref:DNA methyltransferase n=1 Tax=Algiphilus sp. TaxID=1872431 RepID=UPI003BABC1DB